MDSEGSIVDRLADHLQAGTRLDLLPEVPVTEHGLLDPEVMGSWGPDHVIEAEAVRDLLLGRIVNNPDPHGIRLRGARIRGRLDLEGTLRLRLGSRITCWSPAPARSSLLEHRTLTLPSKPRAQGS